ncbi:transcriptional regulator [Paludibacter sp. 221]|uniref:zinc ribbon domain-containing protein n=1 Tax=Paludibacter sp. 221 TaxID=2302939 RepID=UPI0013CFAA64|nr:zinc ribbon domain-containing protein [Paludibacter sp. 221]NDV45753.1 transcriptional regulator [Paludibacter sp. 221]
MEEKICQSCGMPMRTADDFGTNAAGTLNQEYCVYCYKNGAFTQDITMNEMIEHNLNYLDEFNKNSDTKFSKEEARKEMREYFPTLKRWKR